MYRVPAYHTVKVDDPPSTVMYPLENYHQNIDSAFDGKGDCVTSSNTIVHDVSTTPKHHAGKHKTVGHPGGISDFEARQLAVLTQLQQLGSSLDKLSGQSGNKKRTVAQATDVKRQKTESACQPEEPPPPETIVLKEQPTFAVFESKATLDNQFPLNIVVSYANPPPLALLVLASLIRERAAPNFRIGVKAFLHSGLNDVADDKLKFKINEFIHLANDGADLSQCQHAINFIFKKESHPKGTVLLHGACVEQRTQAIYGEAAIAKYLGVLAGFYPTAGLAPQAAFFTSDYWKYTAEAFAKPAYAEIRPNVFKEIEGIMGKRRFLVGDRVSFADLVMWAAFFQPPRVDLRQSSKIPLPPKVKDWFIKLNSTKHFQAARALLH